MTLYEKLQTAILIAQTIVFILTIIVALYIGHKQSNIYEKQSEIFKQQTEISKQILDLPYSISPEIKFIAEKNAINIINHGLTNIFVWGYQVGNNLPVHENNPKLLAPKCIDEINVFKIVQAVLKQFGAKAVTLVPFNIFVSNQRGERFIVPSDLVFDVDENFNYTIYSQTKSIQCKDWERA